MDRDKNAQLRNLIAGYGDSMRLSDIKALIAVLFVAIMMGTVLQYRSHYPWYLSAPVILAPFNYHVGFNKGVELTTTYERGNFTYYGNLAIAEQKDEDITSAQFNFSDVPANGCPESDLQYAATHLVNTDHSQLMTASAGMSYLWLGTRYSVDVIAGSGLRTQNPGDCFNEGTVPSYEQVNLGVSHRFENVPGGAIVVSFNVINLLDETYLLRSGSGVGVFASQYGPRRSFFMGVSKEF